MSNLTHNQLFEANRNWWNNPNSKSNSFNHLPLYEILQKNPQFSYDDLKIINEIVITSGCQDGSFTARTRTERQDYFSEYKFISKRPYITFSSDYKIAKKLLKSWPSGNLIFVFIEEKIITNEYTLIYLANNGNHVTLTRFIDYNPPTDWFDIANVPICDPPNVSYYVQHEQISNETIVKVTVVDPTWNGDGTTLLSQLITILKS